MSNGVSTHNLDAFNKSLAEYARYNKRELGEILENRANRLRWELFKLFKSIAPDKTRLEAEWAALDGRMKRRIIKGKRLTLEQEKKRRRSSLKYLSIGFLLKDWRASKEGQNLKAEQRNRINRRIGEAIVRTAKGTSRPFVEITSFLEGALKMNIERGLVNKALTNQAADMKMYIVKKQKQAQARTIKKMNAFVKEFA